MRKYLNYTILPEFGLILECCKGKASVEDAIEMKKSELSDTLYNPDYNIIVDFREFETNLNPSVRESTEDFFAFLKELSITSRVALLTEAPHQVVISMILKELSSRAGSARMEVFSTEEAAIGFLGCPDESFAYIKGKISELSNNTKP